MHVMVILADWADTKPNAPNNLNTYCAYESFDNKGKNNLNMV